MDLNIPENVNRDPEFERKLDNLVARREAEIDEIREKYKAHPQVDKIIYSKIMAIDHKFNREARLLMEEHRRSNKQ